MKVVFSLSLSLGATLLAWGATLVKGEDYGLARGHLYSKAAVDRFCQDAQKIIGGTQVDSSIALYDTIGDFVGSDA